MKDGCDISLTLPETRKFSSYLRVYIRICGSQVYVQVWEMMSGLLSREEEDKYEGTTSREGIWTAFLRDRLLSLSFFY